MMDSRLTNSRRAPARLTEDRRANFLCLGLLLLFFCVPARAQTVRDLATGKWSFQNATIPLYVGETPAAVVRVEKGGSGRQRRGFFRIGVLPQALLEGVTFEIRDPALATNSLAQIHRWVDPKDEQKVELRRFKLDLIGQQTNSLESALVTVASEGQWKLSSVDFISGTNRLHAARATLQLTGTRSGQLVLETMPPAIYNFFSPVNAIVNSP